MTDTPYLFYFTELRKRLLRCVVVVSLLFLILFFFSDHLFHALALPLLKHLTAPQMLIATAIASPLIVSLKLSFFLAMFLGIPYALYETWSFIAPALWKHEQRFVWPLLLFSVILFYLGIIFAYFVVLPLLFSFFIQILPATIMMLPDIEHYLEFTLKLLLIFGVSFQVPVITVFLAWSGLVSTTTLKKSRPYIIVAAFVIGMLLTPPDVLSQVLLAVPLCLLFEIGFFIAKLKK